MKKSFIVLTFGLIYTISALGLFGCGEYYNTNSPNYESYLSTPIIESEDKSKDNYLNYTYNSDLNGYTVSWNQGNAFADIGYVVNIPSSYNNLPVITVENSAFKGCKQLTSIIIPDSVLRIGDQAFSGCANLTKATIGNGVESIGYRAFYCCISLTNIFIPDSVITIDDEAFSGCRKATQLTIGKNVKSIGNSAFKSCSLIESVTIPDSVAIIGDYAFSNDYERTRKLKNVYIGKNVQHIGEGAFFNCTSLTNITIPKNVTSIGKDAFFGCSLTNVYFENTSNWELFEYLSSTQSLGAVDVTSPSISANFLKYTYRALYWKRG